MTKKDYMSVFSEANNCMRKRQYQTAIFLYEKILYSGIEKKSNILFNIDFCKKRLKHKNLFVNNTEEIALKNFGKAFFGPVLAIFFREMILQIKEKNIKKINFLAREGYFLNQAFQKLKDINLIPNIDLKYLLCSRTFLFKISLYNEDFWDFFLSHHYSGKFSSFLKDRFAFSEEEIKNILSDFGKSFCDFHISLPNDNQKIKDVFRSLSLIKEISSFKKDLYLNYLNQIGFAKNLEEHLIDLGYAGTIQNILSALTNKKMVGHYFVTTNKAKNNKLNQFNGYLMRGIDFGQGHPLLDRSLYMEALLTAPHGQVIDIFSIKDNISFGFGAETNAQNNINYLKNIIDGAIDYAISSVINDNFMGIDELNEYYKKFVNNSGFFPDFLVDTFEIDDAISGFGVINPINFFAKI